jgi:hypothetical protein
MSKARGKQPEFQKPPLPDFLRRMQQSHAAAQERPMPTEDAPGREDELPSIVAEPGSLTAEDERAVRLQHGLSAQDTSKSEEESSLAEVRLLDVRKQVAKPNVASIGKLKKRQAVHIDGGSNDNDSAEQPEHSKIKIASDVKLKAATDAKPKRKRMAMSFE